MILQKPEMYQIINALKKADGIIRPLSSSVLSSQSLDGLTVTRMLLMTFEGPELDRLFKFSALKAFCNLIVQAKCCPMKGSSYEDLFIKVKIRNFFAKTKPKN